MASVALTSHANIRFKHRSSGCIVRSILELVRLFFCDLFPTGIPKGVNTTGPERVGRFAVVNSGRTFFRKYSSDPRKSFQTYLDLFSSRTVLVPAVLPLPPPPLPQ